MIHRHTEIWKMTRERTSFTFDPRDMLLSLQMGFSFVRAAVACAILERTGAQRMKTFQLNHGVKQKKKTKRVIAIVFGK